MPAWPASTHACTAQAARCASSSYLLPNTIIPAGQARHEDWCCGPGRPGPHGCQVGQGLWLRGGYCWLQCWGLNGQGWLQLTLGCSGCQVGQGLRLRVERAPTAMSSEPGWPLVAGCRWSACGSPRPCWHALNPHALLAPKLWRRSKPSSPLYMLALHAINLPIFHPPAAPQVTVISTSPSKKDEALNRLGADNFVVRCAWLGGGCCCARWAVCGELHAAEMWELNVLGGRRLSRAAALLPSSYCGGMFVPPISYWSHQLQHCSRNKEEMEAAAGLHSRCLASHLASRRTA